MPGPESVSLDGSPAGRLSAGDILQLMTDDTNNLVCTGERVIEDAYRASASTYLIYLFHIATYEFSRQFIQNKRVLDFGCGSGYGTHLVAPDCSSITGVDISADAVGYASANYKLGNLDYVRIEDIQTTPLPFDDGAFDTVVSFQVMEHIAQVGAYLDEVHRVLADDGTVVIATPDRRTRLFRGQRPWNEYHIVEYEPSDFLEALGDRFADVEMFGMSARSDVIDIELKRTRLTRMVTYPFTFPGSPEWFRRFGLRTMKATGKLLGSVYSSKRRDDGADVDFGFTLEDVRIDRNLEPSVNILCVARKRSG